MAVDQSVEQSDDLLNVMAQSRQKAQKEAPERHTSAGLKVGETIFTKEQAQQLAILWQEHLAQEGLRAASGKTIKYRCIEAIPDPKNPTRMVACGGITEAARPEERTGSQDFVYCPYAKERHRGQLTPMEPVI